jgi:small subunit ribosomal protein S7
MVKKKTLKYNFFLNTYNLKKNKKTLLCAIINFITKKGKKELAKKIFLNALIKTSKKLNLDGQFILVNVFKRLYAAVEVKDIKRRRKFFKIPFFINEARQCYLGIKWLFSGIALNKNVIAYSDKISLELILILIKANEAKSVFLKNQNCKLAMVNRSNIHYRW